MTVILPSGQGAHPNHNPFPDSLPTFAALEDTVGNLMRWILESKFY